MRVRSTLLAAAAVALCLGAAGASQAQRQRPAAVGVVKSVDDAAKSFVVTMGRGQRQRDVTVKTDATTTFEKGGAPGAAAAAGAFSDVTTGKYVVVAGDGTPDTGITAKTVRILARAPGRGVTGMVKSVDTAGKSMVVSAGRGARTRDVTVKWNDQTRVMVGRQAGAASDIAVGKRVRIQGDGDPSAGVTATVITIVPPAPAGGAGAPPPP